MRRVGRSLGADLVAGERGAEVDYVGLNHLGWSRSVRLEGTERLPGSLADDAALEEIEEARLIGKDWVRADGALPNEYLFYYLHTADAIERITGAATTRGEFLAKRQGDFYLAAAEADGRGPGGSGTTSAAGARRHGHRRRVGRAARCRHARRRGRACCTSPLDLWRETLHEREATYMAESRDEERREEDVAGGGYQEVAMRLMTALATGRPERMILDVGNIGAGREDAPASERIVPERPQTACSRCCARWTATGSALCPWHRWSWAGSG
ncbi:hypothetical protein [Brachybacterium sp. GPGPB12]|uniref:family 4 glycosyl hydrolase n=1 Tax=Brachybacterium sp. GPGPB12 TaxID=3023517 RepID=UPI00313439AE